MPEPLPAGSSGGCEEERSRKGRKRLTSFVP